MPPGILPSEGIQDQLSYVLSATITPTVVPWQLLLLAADPGSPPPASIKLSDLVECNFPGYTRAILPRSQWQLPTLTADGCAVSQWGTSPILWTCTGVTTNKCYGYAMIDAGYGLIRFIQRFDDSDVIDLIQIGGVISLVPQYTYTSAVCADAPTPALVRRGRPRKRTPSA